MDSSKDSSRVKEKDWTEEQEEMEPRGGSTYQDVIAARLEDASNEIMQEIRGAYMDPSIHRLVLDFVKDCVNKRTKTGWQWEDADEENSFEEELRLRAFAVANERIVVNTAANKARRYMERIVGTSLYFQSQEQQQKRENDNNVDTLQAARLLKVARQIMQDVQCAYPAVQDSVAKFLVDAVNNHLRTGWCWSNVNNSKDEGEAAPAGFFEQELRRRALQKAVRESTKKKRDEKIKQSNNNNNNNCNHNFVAVNPQEEPCVRICTLCETTTLQHQYCASATDLYSITCLHCPFVSATQWRKTEPLDTLQLQYHLARRKRRVFENLHSLRLPLASSSLALVHNAMQQAGVTSFNNNNNNLHVTLLEGAAAKNQNFLQSAAMALELDPRCFVTGICTVPTRKQRNEPFSRLLLLQVSVPAWDAWRLWNGTTTRLPQWPRLHVALGTVPKNREQEACRRLEQALFLRKQNEQDDEWHPTNTSKDTNHDVPRQQQQRKQPLLFTDPSLMIWMAPSESSSKYASRQRVASDDTCSIAITSQERQGIISELEENSEENQQATDAGRRKRKRMSGNRRRQMRSKLKKLLEKQKAKGDTGEKNTMASQNSDSAEKQQIANLEHDVVVADSVQPSDNEDPITTMHCEGGNKATLKDSVLLVDETSLRNPG